MQFTFVQNYEFGYIPNAIFGSLFLKQKKYYFYLHEIRKLGGFFNLFSSHPFFQIFLVGKLLRI